MKNPALTIITTHVIISATLPEPVTVVITHQFQGEGKSARHTVTQPQDEDALEEVASILDAYKSPDALDVALAHERIVAALTGE